MPKPLNASALVDRLQSLRPSRQAFLVRLKQGGIAVIAFGGLYLIAPPLWDAVSVSPQQRVEPLKQRIEDLDKQIKAPPPLGKQTKASPQPATADLKELATLEKGRIDSENTIRTSLFQAVGGLLVFVTLYISWLTLKANEAKQVAERFSKAVEQLGNDNIHVRLGGIFMLEQVAKDAEEKYYWQVIEMLTSYVRERSPWNKEKAALLEQEIPPLPTDIQAVMTVLARRKHSYGHPLERHSIDLHGADLRQLQLPPKTQLNEANFAATNLQEAIFGSANLKGAGFVNANLKQASLWDANLQGAILWNANLQKANLWSSDLRAAILWGANLQKASLKEAKLKRTQFKYSEPVLVARFGVRNAVGLTWEQLDEAAFKGKGAILPDYLTPRSQQPHTETAQSTNQATEPVRAEGEIAATPLEETPLAPRES